MSYLTYMAKSFVYWGAKTALQKMAYNVVEKSKKNVFTAKCL